MPKQGKENVAVILANNSIPTLVAICEFVADKLGERLTPEVMYFTVGVLKNMFNTGVKRKSNKGNPWGCKGKPHDTRVKKTLSEYPLMRRGYNGNTKDQGMFEM